MKIWVDLDEVLAEFVEWFLGYHNHKYATNYTKEWVCSYDFSETFGWSKEETLSKVLDYELSDEFQNIQPVVWAKEVLEKLIERHNLYVITSRQDVIQEETLRWIDEHYPNIFEAIYFTNDNSISGTKKHKWDVCDELEVELMIDDYLPYAEDCARNPERKVYLYNRPRNQSSPQAQNIQRISDRNEIDSLI